MIVDVDNVLAWRLHCDKLAAVDWLLKIAVSKLDKYAIVHMFGFVKTACCTIARQETNLTF
jgi:hypothetical protein